MCSTPAPPSTPLVAATIWSGTGDVKISPAHAASSMPGPTNPPCNGSCPDPPPEISPTLPCTGASPRKTTRFSWSTRSSGWAAAMPRRASATTSAGSLMSFFIRCSWVWRRGSAAGLGAPLGGVGGPGGGGLVPSAGLVEVGGGGNAPDLLVLVGDRQGAADPEVVQPGTDEAADERTDDRDPEVDVPVLVPPGTAVAGEEGRQARPEVASGVDGVPGVGAPGHPDGHHDQADDERRQVGAGRRAAQVGDRQDQEQQ